MYRLLRISFWVVLILSSLALHAQNVPGSGWSSLGLFPARGYDFIPIQTPTRYILYYSLSDGTVPTGVPKTGRAVSTDLKTWTVDTSDVCASSGDLCVSAFPRAGVLNTSDGRFRLFRRGTGGMTSLISSDGMIWTQEAGIRLPTVTSIFENGPFALALASFVRLPDGSVRMYYEGGVTSGSAGTPAYYNNNLTLMGTTTQLMPTGIILSALSKDDGLTWVREGVRINPLVHGPTNLQTYPDGTQHTQIDAADLSAVAVKENGQTVYRIYAPAYESTVSYVSTDGLNFTLEGQIPADRGDAKALVLPDGRVWLITNQYPDQIDDMIIYGPQSFSLGISRASVAALSPYSFIPIRNTFQSVLMGVTGTAAGPVTYSAIGSEVVNCSSSCFQAQNFVFSPPSGNVPSSLLVSFAGPSSYISRQLVVHATSGGTSAVGAIFCMDQPLNRADTSVFCKTAAASLPMNKISFGFSAGAGRATQVSNIQSLGGPGYSFTVASSVPWAAVSPATGVAPLPIAVTVDPTGLAAGTYTGVVTITAEGTTEQIAVIAVVAAGPVITSVLNAASYTAGISPNSFVTIFGSGFAASAAGWSPTTSLPTSLGGVQVAINGKSAFISYAGPGQVNVLAPADTASGTVPVQVITAAGTATFNATLAPSAPGWFAYTVGSANWIAALFGNTAIYVAPAGSLSGSTSRSAKAGDILQLYANGLGATNPAAPAGVVLTTAYPLDNLARVSVTIGGLPAVVQYAGMVASGLYQVNVLVPSGVGTGEQLVVMMVDGQITQGATLNFQ